MTGIRTFLALPLEPALPVREKWQQLQKQLLSYRIKWVHPGQFHLTLFFFGKVDVQDIPLLVKKLQSAVNIIPCFTFTLGETGIFQDRSGPRVLWLGIEAPDALFTLKEAVDHAVAQLGFRPDSNAFHPHITLGRFLPGQKITPSLHSLVQEEKSRQRSTQYLAKHLILFKSELFPAGPCYTPLARLMLEPWEG